MRSTARSASRPGPSSTSRRFACFPNARRIEPRRGGAARQAQHVGRYGVRSDPLVDARRRRRARAPLTYRGSAATTRTPSMLRSSSDDRLAERADLLVRLGEAQHVAGEASALTTLGQAANLALNSGNNLALIRAALAADRGFMRTDAGAPEFLAIVEAAVAAADPSDTWTYARLLALLSQSLVFTPQAARRTAVAHKALALAESASDPTLARPRRTSCRLGALGAGERADAQRRCGQGAHRGRILGRPEARVRGACRRLQRGRRIGRRGGGRPQPGPDPRHCSISRRAAAPLDRRALRHIRRNDGRPARRSRDARLGQPGARDRHRGP